MFLVLPLCLRPAEETLTLFDSQARRQEKMEQELQKNAALTGVLGTPAALATNDASSTAQGNRAEIRVDISSPREGQPSQSQSVTARARLDILGAQLLLGGMNPLHARLVDVADVQA